MFHVELGSPHRIEESQSIHQPKRCEYNNEDKDNCPNTLSNESYQASSKKFRQIIS